MLLDRIDIDSHGPLSRLGIGPFSEQLNVVYSAPGRGKTALVRFLRDSLTGTTPAFAGMAQSSGRVVWSAADGLYHCRREPDGTNQGRRFVDFECRVGGYNAERFNRPAVVTDLPMAVVDGIVTDTVMTSARRVVQALLDTGLDRFDTVDAGITASQAARDAERMALRSELARLRDSLRQQGYSGGLTGESQAKEQLAALTLELEALDARREFARQADAAVRQRRLDRQAMQRAVDEVDRLRQQETDLRKRIASLNHTLDRLEDQSRREHDLAAVTQVARKRVAWVNRQVQSLRPLLAEVRQLGDRWFSGQSAAINSGLATADGRADGRTGGLADGPAAGGLAGPDAFGGDELLLQDRGWFTATDWQSVAADDRYLAPIRSGMGTAAEIQSRLERLCQNVDRLVGRLEAEQQHWLAADQTAGELFGEAMSESEQALRRARRRADARFDQAAEALVGNLADGTTRRGETVVDDDSGWIEDSVRRQRIDSLHREQRRRCLDDLTDQHSASGSLPGESGRVAGSEDALLGTMRSIGSTLHSLSRRLRGLKNQMQMLPSVARWTDGGTDGRSDGSGDIGIHGDGLLIDGTLIDGTLITDVYDVSPQRLPLAEQVAAVRRCERELVGTLTELVNHRSALVRRVAAAQTQDIAAEVQWLTDPEAVTETAAWADPSLPPIDVLRRPTEFASVIETLSQSAQDSWNVSDDLWRLADARYSQSRHVREATRRRLESERARLLADLKQAVDRMNRQLSSAEQLRSQLHSVPAVAAGGSDEQLRDRIESEIRRLQHQLTTLPAPSQTLTRYRQCVLRLRSLEAELPARPSPPSRLAASASDHLRRLTGGRLNEIQWRLTAVDGSRAAQLQVRLDGRDEQSFDVADRFLAAVAVRLAAADELSRRGRPLPLVIETPAAATGLPADAAWQGQADWDASAELLSRRPSWVVALAEAARRGRQIILLTSDRTVADAVVQAGGRGYGWDGSDHYPQARSHHAAPLHSTSQPPSTHTGSVTDWTFSTTPSAAAAPFDADIPFAAAAPSAAAAPFATGTPSAADAASPRHSVATRDPFDTVASGGDAVTVDLPTTVDGESFTADRSSAASAASGQPGRRDVVSFPTIDRSGSPERTSATDRTSSASDASNRGRGGAAAAPFFLTGNSPIEQAPSIDALVVARLRSLNILTIAQFLAQTPAELAGRLQLVEVDAATVRRWQAECRLVRGVRGLRGFDARVLVGCGIVQPREVLEAEPAELVERIELFLATPRGSNLLRSGSQRDVARLTQWLDDARAPSRRQRESPSRRQRPSTSGSHAASESHSDTNGQTPRASNRRQRREERREERREGRRGGHSAESSDKPLRFYLQRHSAVDEAPSIGPRMAQRLAALQINTVDDLLAADPAAVAAGLQLRRVDTGTVRDWQQQAILVCRVPMLRGHDAQLLVAAGISQPERLAQCDPAWLLAQIDPVASSRQGQSILRGSSPPDLVEVTDWIRWAQSQRELKAA